MNRIIVEPGELCHNRAVLTGHRARHIHEILKAASGDRLKAGIVNGPCGIARVITSAPGATTIEFTPLTTSPQPWFDLILAMPRPPAFKRLLPQLTALGVGNIWLIGAHKVEKCYFSTHWLRPENYRPLLVEGLMQAGTTPLPQIVCEPRFHVFVSDSLPSLSARASAAWLAHPGTRTTIATASNTPAAGDRRILLAIGPEGGWLDQECTTFRDHGFQPLSLGHRILRSDTATIALVATLAQHHDTTAT